MGKKVHSYVAGGNASWCNHYGKQYGDSSENLEQQFDPVFSLLGLYPKDLNSASYSDAAISIFIAAQLSIAKLWNKLGVLQQMNG